MSDDDKKLNEEYDKHVKKLRENRQLIAKFKAEKLYIKNKKEK